MTTMGVAGAPSRARYNVVADLLTCELGGSTARRSSPESQPLAARFSTSSKAETPTGDRPISSCSMR
ncbi:hypothetical protein [Mycolicibacterium nivoides]|uniref:Uncharacterized protein n=1 Tax=Mycolicibacterium nivoides TaxID=2487344 RepID=A0ABW9LKU3_9MYCO